MKEKINLVEILKEYPERATLETKDGFYMFKCLRKIYGSYSITFLIMFY